MKIKKNNFSKIYLALFALTAFLFIGAVEINQTTFTKADGSGTITLTYIAKDADVTKNNFLIGNYPFEAAKIKEYFSSPNNNLKKSQVVKRNGLYYVNTEIDFKSIYKLKEMKGFAGINSSYFKTDSGMVFYWNLKGKEPNQSGVLDKVAYKFTFEGDIKSTTGLIKDDAVVYYKDTKGGNFDKDWFLAATVNVENVKTTSETNKEESGENKSCGLFGIELPVLLLGGLMLSKRLKK